MAAKAKSASAVVAPIHVVYGDESFRKTKTIEEILNRLFPPEVDRAMALTLFEGGESEEHGGPSAAGVFDDLRTLPFLSERRVVVVRDADKFITAHRESLEAYAGAPAATGILILECKSFPKTTKLYKAAVKSGAVLHECKKLNARGVSDFVVAEATAHGKRIDRPAVGNLIALIGQDEGLLSSEMEKLALFVGDRPTITLADVRALVGQTREEKIFAVMDEAAAGRLAGALAGWRAVLATDPAAAFRAVGGIAFVLRKWLTAHELRDSGEPIRAIAPKVMMWGRENELQSLLARLSRTRVAGLLDMLANLDAQAKSGSRSIENGVEALLIEAAGGPS